MRKFLISTISNLLRVSIHCIGVWSVSVVVFGTNALYAQQLGISLSLRQEPSTFMADWLNSPDALSVGITNYTNESIDVKVSTVLKLNNSIVAYTRTSEMPVLAVSVGTTILTAPQIIPSETMEFYPHIQRTARYNGGLLPGTYTLCVRLVYNVNTDLDASSVVCQQFVIAGYSVPELSEPASFSRFAPGTPITFRWQSVLPVPKDGLRYRFRVYQSRNGQDPLYTYRVNRPVFERFSDDATPNEVVWQPPQGLLRSESRTFVWTVQAVNNKGEYYGNPDGNAEPHIFIITP